MNYLFLSQLISMVQRHYEVSRHYVNSYSKKHSTPGSIVYVTWFVISLAMHVCLTLLAPPYPGNVTEGS